MVLFARYALVCATVAVSLAQAAGADEWRNVAVLSGARLTDVRHDLAYLGTTIDNDNFAGTIARALSRASGVKELEGLDPERRWGAVLRTDDLALEPLAFVPVTDMRAFLDAMSPLVGNVQQLPDNCWRIGEGDLTGYVREVDGWAWLAQTPDALRDLPAAAACLSDAPDDGDLAFVVFPQRLPEAYRTMAIDYVRTALDEAAQQPPIAGSQAAMLAARMTTERLRLIERSLTDVDRATLVWTLDDNQQNTSLELTVEPIAATPLAEALVRLGAKGMAFGRFDDAAICDLAVVWPLPPERAAALAVELAGPADADASSDPRATLFELLRATALNEEINVALQIDGAKRPFTAVAAVQTRDRETADRLFQRMVRTASQFAPAGAGQIVEEPLDTGRRAKLPSPVAGLTDEATAKLVGQVFGPDQTLWLGSSDDCLWLAVGPQAESALGKAMLAPRRSAAPLDASVRLGTLVSLAGLAIDDQNVKSVLSLVALNLRAGDDRATLRVTGGKSLVVRLEARDGVLRGAALGISLAALQSLSGP